MSKLDITVPHQLPREEAVSRIKGLIANLQQEQKDNIQSVKEEWDENQGQFSFKAKGFEVSGNIVVEDDHVRLTGDLPFMLSFFKDTISNVIKDKAGKLLST
jgi:putative polyhydroxyalkanoic acid system protein